jgi:ferredoxin
MKSLRYLDDVTTLTLNPEVCVGCGSCIEVCPHGVLSMNGRTAVITDPNGCMECGACATNCPVQALSLTPGVGCAGYIMQTWLKGKERASCGGPGCC